MFYKENLKAIIKQLKRTLPSTIMTYKWGVSHEVREINWSIIWSRRFKWKNIWGPQFSTSSHVEKIHISMSSFISPKVANERNADCWFGWKLSSFVLIFIALIPQTITKFKLPTNEIWTLTRQTDALCLEKIYKYSNALSDKIFWNLMRIAGLSKDLGSFHSFQQCSHLQIEKYFWTDEISAVQKLVSGRLAKHFLLVWQIIQL